MYLYEISCVDPKVTDTYVHYTRNFDEMRKFHEECCIDDMHPMYVFIREHGGWSNWVMHILQIGDSMYHAKIPGTLNGLACVPEKVPTIYTISCRDPDITENYIGKTTHFDRRRHSHFHSCLREVQLKLYDFINCHGGWSNWEMHRIEEYPHATPAELTRLERYWFGQLGGELNSCVPGDKSYRGDDEEFIFCVRTNLPRCAFDYPYLTFES